jgi:hypothetical protein
VKTPIAKRVGHIPATEGSSAEQVLRELERGQDQDLPAQLRHEIATARERIDRLGGGPIILGRFILDGESPGGGRFQDKILRGGWFATPVRDPKGTLELRQDGFEPLSLDLAPLNLTGHETEVIYVGEIRATRVHASRMASVSGRIVSPDGGILSGPVRIGPAMGPLNMHQASNVQSEYPIRGENDLRQPTDLQGRFVLGGLSPMEYLLTVSRGGSVDEVRSLPLVAGQRLDLGDIVLQPVIALNVDYRSGWSQDLSQERSRSAPAQGDRTFNFEIDESKPKPIRVGFGQRDGSFAFECSLISDVADLGPITLEAAVAKAAALPRDQFVSSKGKAVQDGHSYLFIGSRSWTKPCTVFSSAGCDEPAIYVVFQVTRRAG